MGSSIDAPFFLQNYLVLKSEIKDSNLLTLSLLKFISGIPNKKYAPKKTIKIDDTAILDLNQLENYLTWINRIRKEGNGYELQKLVINIFETLNLNFIEEYRSGVDRGIDIALWNENLNHFLGNPIFVEIKYGLLNESKLSDAENQLRKYIMESNTRSGLLFYLNRDIGRKKEFLEYSSSNLPLIISFDLENFVTELSKNPFEKILIDKRNKIVHGQY